MSNLKSRFKSCLENGAVKSAISALELLETFGGDTQGNPEELKKIIAADPNRLEEKYSLASIYLSQGKHQDAINLLLDIIKVMYIVLFWKYFLFSFNINILHFIQQRDRHWKDDAARELLLKVNCDQTKRLFTFMLIFLFINIHRYSLLSVLPIQ